MNPSIFREYDIRGHAERDFPDEFVADLGLGHVRHEPQREDLPVALREFGDQRLQGLHVLDALESVVLVADAVRERALGVVLLGLGVQ